jgi:sugar lactone lactonase YvrE
MTRSIAVDLFADAHAELGEGPVWDPIERCVYFVDVVARRVHRIDVSSSASRVFDVDRMAGAVALTRGGDLLLAMQGGFARLDPRTAAVRPIATVEADRADIRMNDGKCDPAGRFWAGTMAIDERPHCGSLYRLDPGGRVHTMLSGVSISNGLDWSADARVMYFIDSPTRGIDAFDFDLSSGAIANRRTVARVAHGSGVPDGMTLDTDGCLWVALWSGGAVHRYTPDGTLDAVVHVPCAYPTSCTFGGDDLGDLFITTAATKMSAAEREREPHAGGVFVARPGVTGRVPNRFAE